jgi:hypothetical protein
MSHDYGCFTGLSMVYGAVKQNNGFINAAKVRAALESPA